MYAMITYPVGQLQILYHTIKNFHMYKTELKSNFDGISDSIAAKLMMKNCVDMHLLIIKWVIMSNLSLVCFKAPSKLTTIMNMTF